MRSRDRVAALGVFLTLNHHKVSMKHEIHKIYHTWASASDDLGVCIQHLWKAQVTGPVSETHGFKLKRDMGPASI